MSNVNSLATCTGMNVGSLKGDKLLMLNMSGLLHLLLSIMIHHAIHLHSCSSFYQKILKIGNYNQKAHTM